MLACRQGQEADTGVSPDGENAEGRWREPWCEGATTEISGATLALAWFQPPDISTAVNEALFGATTGYIRSFCYLSFGALSDI